MKHEATFILTITRVDERLYDGEASSVTIPGDKGQLTILAHHEPIIALLKRGIITVRTGDGEYTFEISRGMCEVSNNQVTILVQR